MRFKIFVFLFVTICSISIKNSAFSQNNEVFSINNLLDGDVVFDMNYDYPILKSYTFKDDSLLTSQIHSLIRNAKKARDVEKVFKGYFVLGQLYFYKHNYSQAKYYFTKAQEMAIGESEFIAATYKLAGTKVESEQYIEALEYYRQIKQRVINQGNVNLYAAILLKEGYCYTKNSNFKIADEYFNEAFIIIENEAMKELYGEFFMHKGLSDYLQFNYLNALANFYRGLNFYNQDTIIENYATILNYIGKIYYYQKNYKRAITYFDEVQIHYERTLDVKGAGMAHYECALTNIKLIKYDKVNYHLKKAKKYFSLIKHTKGLALVNLKFAELYNLTEKYDSAILYIQKVTPVLTTANSEIFKFDYYKQSSEYYLNINKTNTAVNFANIAQKFYDDYDIYTKIECNLLYANVMHKIGNYEDAYTNQHYASYLKDSLNKFINSYEIQVLQSELEANRKQVVINTLTNEREIQDKTIVSNKALLEKQKVLIYSAIIVTILLMGFTFMLSVFLRQRRIDNKKLVIRSKQIAQQKEEIEMQSQHLLDVNEELEKLSIIARETDNGIKIMNAVGRVLWVNEGYTKMHGYTLDDLESIENVDLLGENANIDIQQLVNVWYGDKQPISFESLNKTKDGKEVWVQTSLTPILGEEGKIDRMICIDSDISRIKKAEQEIFIKNRDITSSISYAKRIQEAMVTPFSILTNHYKNSFFFHQPKAIVSGDFYWITYRHDKLIVACADSTGHGVPGAFMSMIGISFLNKIVNEKGFVSPDIILNRMRMNIINHLRQSNSDTLAGDGMDMSIITIDIQNSSLKYAGAMNPIIIIRNDEIIELKPNRMPVGYFDNEERPFTLRKMDLKQNDQIYMYTDGYHDQFGGDTGSKMKGPRFKNILKKAAENQDIGQNKFIENEFNKWRGNSPQVDDVLVLGIAIN